MPPPPPLLTANSVTPQPDHMYFDDEDHFPLGFILYVLYIALALQKNTQ